MLTLGRYHQLTRMDGYRFRVINDDTERVLCGANDRQEFFEKCVPIYGRYTLEYSSLLDETIEYHIKCGMTVKDHISATLANDKRIGVKIIDIRDEFGRTVRLVTNNDKFDPGEYALYPVKSSRFCFNKLILRTTVPPVEGKTI